MTAPEDLIRIQLDLECIAILPSGRLVRKEGPSPDPIAKAYLFVAPDGTLYRYLREDVKEWAYDPWFKRFDTLYRTPDRSWSQDKGWKEYGSYILPEPALNFRATPDPEKTRFEISLKEQVVAFCESVRENANAAEAWVFVQEGCRRRGFGKQAVAGWAQWVRSKGKIPFYSHLNDNQASERLAQSLSFSKFAHVFIYES